MFWSQTLHWKKSMTWQGRAQEAPGRLICSAENFFCDENLLAVTTIDNILRCDSLPGHLASNA